MKHAKSLPPKSSGDLSVGLRVGDPVKSKVLEKTNKPLKQMQPDQKAGDVLMLFSLVIQATLIVVGVSQFSDVVNLILIPVFVLLCAIFVAPVSIS